MIRKTVLQGALGKALQRTVIKRLRQVNYDLLEEPFRLRNETDNAWRCEFWGKIVRSSVSAAFFTGDTELKAKVERTVQAIIATQTPDGCISSYPAERQLGGWDIWGRKYVLLALLRYYEMLNQNPLLLQCCCRMVDHLMTQVGSAAGQTDILRCGMHNGLAASSILGAIVSLWRITGCARYREFVDYLIERGCSSDGNIFLSAHSGVTPAAIGNGKAYEMTSCFQGLAELEILEPDLERHRTVRRYYDAVSTREIFITGTGGLKDISGEFWYDGALRQTRGDCGGLGETCITVTWLHYCFRIWQLTEDPKVMDEIENSLYNGLLGALAPDGSHWVHTNPTPLTGGWKRCAGDQIFRCFKTTFDDNDCCRAQGPEGLAFASELAVIESENSLTVNFFEPLVFGNFVIEGNYPYEPKAVFRFTLTEQRTLRVRIPIFMQKVSLNSTELAFSLGKYLEIERNWTPEDELILEFDFSLQEIHAPDGSPFVAVKRGPLVLAADSRGVVPEAAVQVEWRGISLCDYASAGNQMQENNTLTVWFPDIGSCQLQTSLYR